MAAFKLDILASLARQMGFAPRAKRLAQLAAAESLLLEIDPDRGYPPEFVVYRLTGYRPAQLDKSKPADDTSDLLAGVALQHDLGLLVETVSEGLAQPTSELEEPILTIDDVAARFGCTGKTIQRWRRKGLPARRMVFDDGKSRVAFRLSVIEKFIAAQDGAAERPAGTDVLEPELRDEILRRARGLALAGHNRQEIVRRVARRVGRSSLAVLHTIDRYDPSITQHVSAAPDEALAARAVERVEAGEPLRKVAEDMGLSRVVVYRAMMEDRAEKLTKQTVRYIDDPLFHGPDAADHIRAIAKAAESSVVTEPGKEVDRRVPRNLPPVLIDLYRAPLLSAAREKGLFLLYNFHKFRFAQLRAAIDPLLARARELHQLEAELAEARKVRNEIVHANLRLVVSVARRHLRPGLDLMELVSDGNLVLMRAVEGFDISRGFKFSTYATLALMKGFARSVGQMQQGIGASLAVEELAATDETVESEVDRRDLLGSLLRHLEPRERHILTRQFGVGRAPTLTAEELGRSLGLSRQRIRQIEQAALAKLRDLAPVQE